MSVLDLINKVGAQVNPFDGGKTWSYPAGSAPVRPLPLYSASQQSDEMPAGFENKPNLRPLPTSPGVARSIQTAADNVLNTTGHVYGLTSDFIKQLRNTNPTVLGRGIDAHGALGVGGQASGAYNPIDNNIQLGQLDGLMPDANTLAHEGLHSTWQNNQNVHSQFSQAYKQSLNPDLAQYLDSRLHDYAVYQGPQTLNNFDTLTPAVQTEVHSYIPEYYANSEDGSQMPGPLSNYYSQYFNSNQPAQYDGIRDSIMRKAGLYKKYYPNSHRGGDRGA